MGRLGTQPASYCPAPAPLLWPLPCPLLGPAPGSLGGHSRTVEDLQPPGLHSGDGDSHVTLQLRMLGWAWAPSPLPTCPSWCVHPAPSRHPWSSSVWGTPSQAGGVPRASTQALGTDPSGGGPGQGWSQAGAAGAQEASCREDAPGGAGGGHQSVCVRRRGLPCGAALTRCYSPRGHCPLCLIPHRKRGAAATPSPQPGPARRSLEQGPGGQCVTFRAREGLVPESLRRVPVGGQPGGQPRGVGGPRSAGDDGEQDRMRLGAPRGVGAAGQLRPEEAEVRPRWGPRGAPHRKGQREAAWPPHFPGDRTIGPPPRPPSPMQGRSVLGKQA